MCKNRVKPNLNAQEGEYNMPNIATRTLQGLENYKFKELPEELQLKVLRNLKAITYKFLMFVDNFITFFCDNLIR